MPSFITEVQSRSISGPPFEDEDLRKFDYYNYLMSRRHPGERNEPKGDKRVIELMREFFYLYEDIRTDGLKNPIDLWVQNGRYVLYRGGRRLEILKALGVKKVPCRVFESKDMFRIHNPSVQITEDNSIHNLARKQFQKYRELATDKYWVHNYLNLYDAHIGYMGESATSILELGVFRGASLLLWEEAFPNAQVYGVDIKPRHDMLISDANTRIKTFKGRQEDEQFMSSQVIPRGPFDIIIDDGGHKPLEMRGSFNLLWESVRPGGWYVVEDLYGNYRKGRIQHTIMEHLKNMVDEMNIQCKVQSMHFYYNICFIQKSLV